MAPQKIIIDTDPGIDDALAIHLALADPRLDVIGLTTVFGNVYVEQATRNALHLVEMAGRDIPVAHGAGTPYAQPLNNPSHFVHGDEGFGDLPAPQPSGKPHELDAARFITDMAERHGKDLVLCPVGPLANIANALDLDPDLPSKIGRVVIMGGAVTVDGNITPYAEANIYNDPEAAERVFKAGFDLEIIGLDVTNDVLCSRAQLAEITAAAPRIGGFLNDISDFYLRFYQDRRGFDGCALHDPAAIIAITDPHLFTYEEQPVDVVLEGERRGQTVANPGSGSNTRYAIDVQKDAVLNHFLETLKAVDQRLS